MQARREETHVVVIEAHANELKDICGNYDTHTVLKIFASSSMIASVILKENVVIWEYFNKTIKSDSH